MLTDEQKAKIIAAVQPLYSDSDFSQVTDFSVTVTSTPPPPTAEVEQVGITHP